MVENNVKYALFDSGNAYFSKRVFEGYFVSRELFQPLQKRVYRPHKPSLKLKPSYGGK